MTPLAVFMMFAADADANIDALARRAKAAVDDRPCEASALYQAAYKKSPEAKYLFNAAEVALAARDRVEALRLYRALLKDHPAFELNSVAEERVTTVAREIVSFGPGTACPARSVCGDGDVADDEMCDDGNDVSGDGCNAACTAVDAPQHTQREDADADKSNNDQSNGPSNEPSNEPTNEQTNELLWIGVTAVGAGIIGVALSSVPLIGYAVDEAKIESARAQFEAESDEGTRALLLEDSAATQASLAANRAAWNNIGAVTMVVSTAIVVGGVVVIVTGLE